MALIFNKFDSREQADAFAGHVRKTYNRKVSVYDSQDAAAGEGTGKNFRELMSDSENVYDVFPWQLDAPIVLVERIDEGYTQEELIEADVEKFAGVFAGT